MKRKKRNKQADPAYHRLDGKSDLEVAAYHADQRGKNRFKKAWHAATVLDHRGCNPDGVKRIAVTGSPRKLRENRPHAERGTWVDAGHGRKRLVI